MDKYEPFDLKVTKLTGKKWDRNNLAHLAEQLFEKQGKPRASIENRIIICFDESPSSSIEFLKANEDLIILSLLDLADNPYKYISWVERYKCWVGLILLEKNQYYNSSQGIYYEHSIGKGLREPVKAKFEESILKKVARMRTNIKPNPNTRAHGNDGQIRIDRTKIDLYQALPTTDDYVQQPDGTWRRT